MYSVILYYKFTRVDDPEDFCREHRRLCSSLDLSGRVYVSHEGINGTLAGTVDNIQSYQQRLLAVPGFEDTQFKEDRYEAIPFQRLIVKTRPEIVALKAAEEVDPLQYQAKYLSPEEWRDTLDREQDCVVIDIRNNYESAIGHFENAIRPDVENFYDFPQWLDKAPLDKSKTTLIYCTGGIRCEKFAPLMEKKGFKKVYQLHGGIINYAKRVGDKHYKGKCFVFDDRLVVPVEENQAEPLTRCDITGEPCDRYINCANVECNKLFICSETGAKQMEGCCSEECLNASRRRPFDPDNIYAPSRRYYQYSQMTERGDAEHGH